MGTVEVHARHVGGMEHRAEYGPFSFSSDEPPGMGGQQGHPLPLTYFTASIGLCAMTQVARFADQMRIGIDDVTATVESRWDRTGSVLAGTVQSRCVGFSMDLDVRSSAPTEHIAALVQNAHAGCFAEQALLRPTTVNTSATLNGTTIETQAPDVVEASQADESIKHFPIEVELRHVGGVSHEARWNGFSFSSDEPPHLGGADEHPIPIAYFVGSVGFCVMTQLVRYAKQLDIPLENVESRSASHFSRQGSVKAGTVLATLDAFDVHIDVSSPAGADEVASLLGLAHRGCYAQSAVHSPVTIESTTRHNGEALDYTAYPRRIA